MSMQAWVFVRFNGAQGLGHVGWAFQWDAGRAICGATENPSGGGLIGPVAAKDKGAWHSCIPLQDVLREFTRSHVGCPAYDAVKVINVPAANPGNAWNTMSWCEQQDYWVTGIPRGRNCMDDAFDVLTALGLPNLPWPTTNPAPNGWFAAMPGTQMSLQGMERALEIGGTLESFAMPEAHPVKPVWRVEGTVEHKQLIKGMEEANAMRQVEVPA